MRCGRISFTSKTASIGEHGRRVAACWKLLWKATCSSFAILRQIDNCLSFTGLFKLGFVLRPLWYHWSKPFLTIKCFFLLILDAIGHFATKILSLRFSFSTLHIPGALHNLVFFPVNFINHVPKILSCSKNQPRWFPVFFSNDVNKYIYK